MISFAKIKSLMRSQKYDCSCFYRTSKTNKKAKRSSNKVLRQLWKKELINEK